MCVCKKVVKCENCDFELWSIDPDEILQWKELIEHEYLLCLICGGNMKFNGGENVSKESS